MILLWLMLVLAPPARASEPPFYLRETAGRRDVGGINENDRALADSIRRSDLTNGGSVAGSLTLTGTGNGIVFPDGTTQTTAASAAGGAPFGPTAVTSTVTLTNPATGSYTITASTSFTSSTSNIFITGFSTGMQCNIEVFYRQVTADGYWQLRHNNDSGSNYTAGIFTVADNGGTGASSRGGTEVTLQRANDDVGETGYLKIEFRYDPLGSQNVVGSIWHHFGATGGAPIGRFEYGGYRYRGALMVESLLLINQNSAGGSKTGTLDVVCLRKNY